LVSAVLVEPGRPVTAGEALVRLDTAQLELELATAREEVAARQAALDQLLAGASRETIERAEREHARQVAQAETALQIGRHQLAKAEAQDPASEIAAARAAVRQADLQLAQARAQDPAPDVKAAQVHLERARVALEDTRNEYNKALDRPWEDQSIRDGWAKQLEQAQFDYALAEAQLESALNAQRAYQVGLQLMQAQLEGAQARLAGAIDAQRAYSETLTILRTEIEGAERQLEALRAWENPYLEGPTEEQVAQARARVRQAELNLAQAEEQLADAEMRAPFAGTVSEVHIRAGEYVSPGQPLVDLADLSTLRAETTDLSERDVVQVEVGQGATVFVEALGQEVGGEVVAISPEATKVGGDTVYGVTIALSDPPVNLRWGMSLEIEIEVE
jgi:multidrug resistance efflux pump